MNFSKYYNKLKEVKNLKIKELTVKEGKTIKKGSDYFRSEITLLGALSDKESQNIDSIQDKYIELRKLARSLIK